MDNTIPELPRLSRGLVQGILEWRNKKEIYLQYSLVLEPIRPSISLKVTGRIRAKLRMEKNMPRSVYLQQLVEAK